MKDARGIPLAVGQPVAVAQRGGNVAYLSTGCISKLDEEAQTVSVVWDKPGVNGPRESTLSFQGKYVMRHRFAVLSG